jgi:hypothetical protein
VHEETKFFRMTDGKLAYYRKSPKVITRGILISAILLFLLMPYFSKDVPVTGLLEYHVNSIKGNSSAIILPALLIAFIYFVFRSYCRENLMATNGVIIDREKGTLEFGEYINSRHVSRRSIRRKTVKLEYYRTLRIGDTRPEDVNAHSEPVTVYIVEENGSEIPLTAFNSESLARSFTSELSDLIGIPQS